jgi:peptide/nickel transport system substrate-binding protein
MPTPPQPRHPSPRFITPPRFGFIVLLLLLFLLACNFGGPSGSIVPADLSSQPQVRATRTPNVTIAPNRTAFVIETFGDPETLDPALSYEQHGNGILEQVYETLVTHDGARADYAYLVPQVAADMPTISEDGLLYTFTIREGVTFHEGGTLTADDVAYSLQRGLLQGGYSSPQLLFTEPFLGAGVYDVSELLFTDADSDIFQGDPLAVQTADPTLLRAVCEQVQAAIRAEGNTVTLSLATSWSPLLATLAGSWGSIMDKEWVIENGGWDGSCTTWQNFYGQTAEQSPFTARTNGTGPYRLQSWSPDDKIVLAANENYWRTDAVWLGAPNDGVVNLKTIEIRNRPAWETRLAALQSGEADSATVLPGDAAALASLIGETCTYNAESLRFDCTLDDAQGRLRHYTGAPAVSRTDLLFTWQIESDGDNPFIGSGTLDGEGIPPDFFSDVQVRRGFAHCIDDAALIRDVYQDAATPSRGLFPPQMMGYEADAPTRDFDLEQCRAELAQAWGGVLPETGFYLQVLYNTGGTEREAIFRNLQANLHAVSADNPTPHNYRIEVVGVPWSEYLTYSSAGRFPMFIGGWREDIHDPHNWASPFLVGVYAARMRLPESVVADLQAQVTTARSTQDFNERDTLYENLNRLDYDQVFGIRLPTPTHDFYEQRWVGGWHYNPARAAPYYYALWK